MERRCVKFVFAARRNAAFPAAIAGYCVVEYRAMGKIWHFIFRLIVIDTWVCSTARCCRRSREAGVLGATAARDRMRGRMQGRMRGWMSGRCAGGPAAIRSSPDRARLAARGPAIGRMAHCAPRREPHNARMTSEPSTQWKEQVAPDEDARFGRLAEQLRELQRRNARRSGAGRALHRKGHVGVEASFEVRDGLPAAVAQGLFARPGRYRAYVRFSNGASAHQADGKGDVRGAAIKVLGVAGRKIIPGLEAATTQDFLLIQSATTPFRGPDEFVAFVRAAASPATALPRLLFGVGPRRLIAVGGALRRSLAVPVHSLATMAFHSALPVRWGDYAGKYRLTPVDAAPASGGHRDRDRDRDRDHLAAELAARLAAGALRWDLAVQLYRDPVATPIEDSTVPWSDDAAPPIAVARLTLDRQDLGSERARAIAAFVERLAFDPWHALVEHRPLGAMMRARNHAYRLSTAERGAAAEPDGSEAF
jgi:hypothetical protein